jgi:hypothetical protein
MAVEAETKDLKVDLKNEVTMDPVYYRFSSIVLRKRI